MEISGIRSALPFMFPTAEREGEVIDNSLKTGDTVDLRAPALLADDEVDGVLQETIDMIGQDGAAALSVHSLSEQRVFALLGI